MVFRIGLGVDASTFKSEWQPIPVLEEDSSRLVYLFGDLKKYMLRSELDVMLRLLHARHVHTSILF